MTCETRSGGIARPGAVSRAPPGAPGAGWGATPSAQQTRPPSIDQQQAQACVRREDKTCQGDRPPVEFFAPPAQGAGGRPLRVTRHADSAKGGGRNLCFALASSVSVSVSEVGASRQHGRSTRSARRRASMDPRD